MTSKQDVAAFLANYAERKAQKAGETQVHIASILDDVRRAYQRLSGWVNKIPGVEVEQVAANDHLHIDDESADWYALHIKFADTYIVFQPELRQNRLHFSYDMNWDDEKSVFLRLENNAFGVYGSRPTARLGVFDQDILLGEIIRITQAQPI